MSTLLMSSNLEEPFFPGPTDPKEYLHSFSESIINFGPGLAHEMSVVNNAVPVSISNHYHLGPPNVIGSPCTLSGIIKFEEDTHLDDFHPEHHSMCSPCLVEGEYRRCSEPRWLH